MPRMESLPIAPSCALEEDGRRAQAARYRLAGEGAIVLEHGPRRLSVRLGEQIDVGRVQELIAIERECCPFFEIGWDPASRKLTIAVRRGHDEPALAAIALALGIP